MDKDKDVIIIEIENNEKSLKNENQVCYICQEKPTDPINPGGCNHFFCRIHLKVI